MVEDRVPKIFISYSWSSDSFTLPLAERLVSHGIDVVIDKWDLKEGQDKYAFMEQSVTNPDITKVLIICDRVYTEKANARKGGVGDETIIISSEIYGKVKQEKFIPIIVEKDAEGKPYVPAYIKSLIFIDLSEEEKFEEEYEKLVRNIYEKPLFRKPQLGTRPEWLDDEKTNLFPLKDLLRQVKGSSSEKKQRSCVSAFTSKYVEILKTYFVKGIETPKIFERFKEMKEIRDVFLDFLPLLYETDISFQDTICDVFEEMYNTLTCAKGFDVNAMQARDSDYEIFHIHIWELFICVIAFLRYRQEYRTINAVLSNTYFLTDSCLIDTVKPRNFCRFRYYSSLIEDEYKPQTEYKSKFTLLGHTIYHEREKMPIYTGKALAEADLFLYQIVNGLTLTEDDERDTYWFPTLYVYAQTPLLEWSKIKSRKFCEKLYDLFGVKTFDEFKEAVSKCTYNREMRYRGNIDAAPAILSCIKLEEIGSIN